MLIDNTLLMSMSKPFKYRIIGRGREIISYFNNYLKPRSKDQIRVAIFGQGRTGSTLLESLLCSTEYFYKNGELLKIEQDEIMFPSQFIRGLSKWKSNKNFIFHVKIYQLTRDRKRPIDPSYFIETLYNDGFNVIYLRRKNIIKHYLSNLVAEQRGEYHKFDDRTENLKLFIDCNSFVNKVKERIRFNEEEIAALANIEYLEVTYEDDLESSITHQNTVNKILKYLSLEKKEAITKFKKINTSSLKELISNYDEFAECMTVQGWENYLDQ